MRFFSSAYWVGAMCLCVIRKQCRNVKGARCPVALMQPDVVEKHCDNRCDAGC